MPEKPEFPHLLEGPDLSQRDDTLAQIVDTMPSFVDKILSAEFPGQACINSVNLSFTLGRAFDAGVLAIVRSMSRAAEGSGVDIPSLFAAALEDTSGTSLSGLRQNVEDIN